jgi:orotidine-5'-phosphate decarboxylase
MTEGFAYRLKTASDRKNSAVIVGLDPDVRLLPRGLTEGLEGVADGEWFVRAADIVFDFGRQIIDAVSDIIPAIKPQVAFYEKLGPAGMEALRRTIAYARRNGLIVILDAKRNDIESTATAYAESYLGSIGSSPSRNCAFDVDALTINPYLGSDGVLPFLQAAATHRKGIFVLVKTSNPSAAEFQDLPVIGRSGNEPLFHVIARKVNQWGAELTDSSQYSAVGAVVGATFPQEAFLLREIMPRSFFLVPGVGAQGGDISQLSVFFDRHGSGALVAASRSVIYAYRHAGHEEAFQDAARKATIELRASVERARAKASAVKRP